MHFLFSFFFFNNFVIGVKYSSKSCCPTHFFLPDIKRTD